ncbi:MAG: hypothetical protein ACFFCO_03400 [Promethearchaeota archaeon]
MTQKDLHLLGKDVDLGKVTVDLVFGDSAEAEKVSRILVIVIVDTYCQLFWGKPGSLKGQNAFLEVKASLRASYPALKDLTILTHGKLGVEWPKPLKTKERPRW